MADKRSIAIKEAKEREAREKQIASLKKRISKLEKQVKELALIVSGNPEKEKSGKEK